MKDCVGRAVLSDEGLPRPILNHGGIDFDK